MNTLNKYKINEKFIDLQNNTINFMNANFSSFINDLTLIEQEQDKKLRSTKIANLFSSYKRKSIANLKVQFINFIKETYKLELTFHTVENIFKNICVSEEHEHHRKFSSSNFKETFPRTEKAKPGRGNAQAQLTVISNKDYIYLSFLYENCLESLNYFFRKVYTAQNSIKNEEIAEINVEEMI